MSFGARASEQSQAGVAGEGLEADFALAVSIALVEARAGAEVLALDLGARRRQVAAEALAADFGRQVLRQVQAKVADRYDVLQRQLQVPFISHSK